MSKILLTGCTKTQANDTGRMQNTYVSNPKCLYDAMVKAGHEVDWRPVIPGEDLNGYDVAIIGMAPPNSLGSKHMYGALWTVAWPMPKAYLVDDWKIGNLVGGLRSFEGKPEQMFKRTLGGKWNAANPRANIDLGIERGEVIMAALSYLNNNDWNEPVLGSFFEWGDRTKWLQKTRIKNLITFDPSVYQHDYGIVPAETKERRWICGAMADHTPWVQKLGVEWPVDMFGVWRKQERLTEDQLMRLYEKTWGVMSPKYDHAGSGWWRARFDFAAQAGCVLLASPEEVEDIGGAYLHVAKNPRNVENMTDSELKQLAADQKGLLYEHRWSEEKLLKFADDVITELSQTSVNEVVPVKSILKNLLREEEHHLIDKSCKKVESAAEDVFIL